MRFPSGNRVSAKQKQKLQNPNTLAKPFQTASQPTRHNEQPMNKHLLPLALMTAASIVSAAPTPSNEITRRANTAVLSQQHNAYTFHTLDIKDSQNRPHRIFIGIPKAAPPARGFPALYALDGNALLEYLAPDRLKLPPEQLPVLVLIGYPTELRFDTAARAYDYTPPDPQGKTMPDQLTPERSNGGAPQFLKFILHQVRPQIDRLAPTDPHKQTLWGHSYGGLFVLHTLFNEPQAFTRYVAADPSLWWQNGLMLQYAEPFFRRPPPSNLSLTIEKSGTNDNKRPANPQQAAMLSHREAVTRAVPPDSAKQLAERLRQHGLQVQYRHHADLTHGGVLTESFEQTLPEAAK